VIAPAARMSPEPRRPAVAAYKSLLCTQRLALSRKFPRVPARFGGCVAARPGPAPAVTVAEAALRTPSGRPAPAPAAADIPTPAGGAQSHEPTFTCEGKGSEACT
jgi:hypothetical protein